MENEYFASINEVSARLGVPAYTLRYWEKQFPAAVRPTTGAGGRRYYRMETVKKLEVIRGLLYDRGMTIAGVKKLIRAGQLPSDTSDDVAVVEMQPAAPAAPRTDNSAEISRAIALLENARKLLA